MKLVPSALFASICSLTLVNNAYPQALIDWGQSTGYVTAAAALNGWTETDGATYSGVKTFSTSDASSPLSGYTTPSGLSGSFYGGSAITGVTAGVAYGGFNTKQIADNAGTAGTSIGGYDTFNIIPKWRFVSGTPTANTIAFTSAIVFKQSDFLNGFNTGSVSLSANDSYSINWKGTTNFGSNSRLRLIVQNNSSWYISSVIASVNSSGATSSNTFSSLTWFNYDPVTAIQTVSSAATPTFNSVTAIGFWAQIYNGGGSNSTGATPGGLTGGNGTGFLVSDFTITAAAIPEPSTYAALAGLGALGFVMWQRRRRAQVTTAKSA